MHLSFVYLPLFSTRWKQARLDDEDLRAMEHQLLENPEAGAVVAGTGGLRKMRFSPPSRRRGKSGAFRVCYLLLPMSGHAVLFTMFAKSDQQNLITAEKSQVKAVVEATKKRLW
jgi:hypothetical protein